MGMKPSAIQGMAWFLEKKLWGDNGWSRLDLGNFQEEMKKLPMLRAGIKQRLKKSKAEAKLPAGKEQELELLVEPRKMK